jgi:hypothetical protein
VADPSRIKFVGPKFQPDGSDSSGRLLWGLGALGVAMILLVGGLYFFLTAHRANPTLVVGTVTTSWEGSCLKACWPGREVNFDLAGNPREYYFIEQDFPPQTPHQLPTGTAVTAWVDHGTSKVLALSVAGQQYASQSFDNPDHLLVQDRLESGVIIGAGVLFLLIGVGFFTSRRDS